MESTLAHARRYRELLYQHGHGYPFWVPEPDDALPDDLKNVYGSKHRRSKSEVPSEFEPLPSFEDVRKADNFFVPNRVITSASVNTREIKLEGNVDAVLSGGLVGGDTGVEFSADGDSGAVLILPLGGSRFDADADGLSRSGYQRYAAHNAGIWYRHLSRLGRRVKNGALYLITGADKCSSWGVASFAKSSASQGLDFTFLVPGGASASTSVTNTWITDYSVKHRTGVVSTSETSQCIFARGFVIALRNTVWTRLFELDPRPDIQAVDTSGVRPSLQCDRGDLSEGRVQPLAESALFPQKIPAAVLADVFLDKTPDASYAVIHDNDWIVPVIHGELRAGTAAFFEELRGYAMKFTNIVADNDVCIIPDTGTSDEMPYTFDAAMPSGSLSQQKTNMFALVIGINEYENSHLNLGGAAPDADAVCEYLTEKLRVESGHIRTLRNHEATRTAILNAISDFKSDQRIQTGDPLLIYYAGHGAEADPPSDWEAGGPNARIQMILPHDFSDETSLDINRQGIQDLHLSQLLFEISQEKGDNITVIFDCCHAGSGTRDPLLSSTRGVVLPKGYKVLKDALKSAPAGLASAASHVLLAACSQYETSREGGKPRRGFFTSALLKVLRDVDERIVTYRDVLAQLQDLPSQHPQCEGTHLDRFLFDGKVTSRRPVLYPVVADGEGHELGAGQAHGIAEGAQFDIYGIPNTKSQRLCTAVVSTTGSFSAVFADALTIPGSKTAWALQTKIGNRADLTVFLDPKAKFFVDVKNKALDDARAPPLRFIDNEKDSYELAIREKDGMAVFYVNDDIAGLTSLPHTVSIDDTDKICAVINSAAHFFFHLRRSNPASPLKCSVTVEAFALEYGKRRGPRPSGPNMVDGGMILLENPTGETDYGFKLTSNYDSVLYVSAFMFNMCDFEIGLVYQPGYAKTVLDPSVPAKGSLTLGYGAGGASPQAFMLPPGMKEDVTYLKFFLTSEPLTFPDIPQKSPFEPLRKAEAKSKLRHPVWDSVLIPIVQRKV